MMTLPTAVGGEDGDGFLKVGADRAALSRGGGQLPQHRLRAEDQLGPGQQLPSPGGQARQAVGAYADDVNARIGGFHGQFSHLGQGRTMSPMGRDRGCRVLICRLRLSGRAPRRPR